MGHSYNRVRGVRVGQMMGTFKDVFVPVLFQSGFHLFSQLVGV